MGSMADQFDVIVVGARCAGSPLATFLARAGMRVCLVDRAAFPSDTPSTHAMQPAGVKILDRLGVLEQLLRVVPPLEYGITAFDDVSIELGGVRELLGAPMLSVRRVTLDAILLDAAKAAGVEVRTQTAVTDLVEEGGRVTGVKTPTGELRARLVVGADGARSTVARLVDAAEYHRTPPGRAFLWAYFEGTTGDDSAAWLGKVGDHAFLGTPTDAGLFMAAVAPSIVCRDELRRDREAGYVSGLRRWPELEARVAGARRVGPIRMMSRWHGFFRQSAGPGWVLVGDAGHFKDPTPGQGIADALRQAVQLATAIETDLGGSLPRDQALRDWWAWRDRDAWEMYWFSHDMGARGPTPLVLREIQRRMAADPQLAEQFMRVLNHDLTPSSVFTPALLLSTASKAFLNNRGRRRVLLRELRRQVGDEVRRRTAARGLQPAPVT
jgi:2-polyprenyl-6-methoxyphenol hydroxylase-like FAD-dependent oxidoreductase